MLSACSSVNRYYDSDKPHHTPEGFKNNYEVMDSPATNDVRYPSTAQKQLVNRSVPLTANWLHANRTQNSATFVGHSTALIQLGGLNILTDPQFSDRASPISFVGPKRQRPPAALINQLPPIDVVVISHNHYDHLDLPSIKKLLEQPSGQPLIIVPIGNGDLIKSMGAKKVQELDWWSSMQLGETRIHSVPVHHWSARTLWDKNCALWGGWVFESKAGRVFFAGDTAYSPDFKDIAKRFESFDFALVPIGAYAPRSVMKSRHVNPDEAVQIHLDLKSKRSMAIHWGSFELTDEPVEQPIIDLESALRKAQLSDDVFFVPKHGATHLFVKGQ